MFGRKKMKYALAASVAAFTVVEVGIAYAAMDEILVRARKREETLQSVPVAVTAFNESFIERTFNENLSDLDRFLPNVELGDGGFTGGQLAVSIRGFNFSEVEKSFEPTVGISVDGVFLGSGAGASVEIFDIEQIEVLRGPQGTLFGRNTIGGAVNIRRTRPTGEWGVTLNTRLGSYNQRDFGGVLNLPQLADQFSVKVYAFRNKGDFATRNARTGERDEGEDYVAIGGAVLWEPTPEFEALFSFDTFNDDRIGPPQLNLTVPNADLLAVGRADLTSPANICDLFGASEASACKSGSFDVAAANDFKTSFGPGSGYPFKTFIDGWNAILEVNWDVGDFTVTSISGFMENDESLIEENTGTLPIGPGVLTDPLLGFTDGLLAFTANRQQEFRQFSQELRITTNHSGPFNYVAGLYYLTTKYQLDGGIGFVPGFPRPSITFGGAPAGIFASEQDVDAYAAYAEGIYEVTDKFRITGGFRFTYEEKDFTMDRVNFDDTLDGVVGVPSAADFIPAFVDPGDPTATPFRILRRSKNWASPTGRVILDYQFNDDIFGYASWTRGFRSGGFDGRGTVFTVVNTPFDQETVRNVEVGFRTEWFDQRLRFNPTFFWTKYNDKQEERLTTFIGATSVPETVTITSNAASATLWGVELEALAIPVENLTLRAAVGYLNAEFDSFVDEDSFGNPIDISNTAELRRAPEWTLAFGGEYVHPVPNTASQIIGGFNVKYTDEFFTSPVRLGRDPFRRDTNESYTQVDFSVGMVSEVSQLDGTQLSVTGFVRDAFHGGARPTGAVNAGPFYFGQVTFARTWGVEVSLKY